MFLISHHFLALWLENQTHQFSSILLLWCAKLDLRATRTAFTNKRILSIRFVLMIKTNLLILPNKQRYPNPPLSLTTCCFFADLEKKNVLIQGSKGKKKQKASCNLQCSTTQVGSCIQLQSILMLFHSCHHRWDDPPLPELKTCCYTESMHY